MRTSFWLLGCAAVLVAGCVDITDGTNSDPSDGFMKELPEGVMAVVAPNQNLQGVRIDPVDGCYVYQYAGPVETTMLPLRTRDGRPICTRAADAPVEDAAEAPAAG